MGSKLEIVCPSWYNVTWYFNKGPTPKNSVSYKHNFVSNTLLIENIQYDNAGVYQCKHTEEGVHAIMDYIGESEVEVRGTLYHDAL